MNKLERHIKTRLHEREILPSSDAWNKVKEELGSDKVASPSKIYWWAVAAGFIGLIVLSIQFFDSQSSLELPRNTSVVKKASNTVKTFENNERKMGNANVEKLNEALRPQISMDKEKGQDFKNGNTIVQVPENEVSNDPKPLNDLKEVTDLAITNKLDEVLAQVNVMESDSTLVSDKEIDSLLMVAQRELMAEKTINENGKVDAMALLNEVELELYDSQQNPLFIRLKEGFFKLRTAVADRNN